MTVTATIPPRPPLALRLLHAIPVLGWIARDVARHPGDIWYALVILLTLVVLGVQTWGIVALTMAALMLVPVMFVVLIIITLG